MVIRRKTRKLVDQVFVKNRGWIEITPTALRRLWWQDRKPLMQFAESIHLVDFGDYRISELS